MVYLVPAFCNCQRERQDLCTDLVVHPHGFISCSGRPAVRQIQHVSSSSWTGAAGSLKFLAYIVSAIHANTKKSRCCYISDVLVYWMDEHWLQLRLA